MTPRRSAVLTVVIVVLAGCQSPARTEPPGRGSPVALRTYDSCPALLRAARQRARDVRGPVMVDAVPATGALRSGAASTAAGAAPAAPTEAAGAFTSTNLQEAGVDEPDIVKNDGSVAYRLDGSTLRSVIVGAGGSLALGSELSLPVDDGGELLLAGRRVVVIAPNSSSTRVVVVDASDPSALRVVQRVDVDGREVSARQVGDSIRLVVAQGVAVDPIESTVNDWVPATTACDRVYVPPAITGLGSTSVVTLSASDGKVVDSTSVLGTASEVYASPSHLYLAASTWSGDERTQIHRFDITDPRRAVYQASGEVSGHLLRPPWFAQGGPIAQWSMSESGEDLRVATTTTRVGNAVSVLRRDGARLDLVGRAGGIAPGEQLYAVRFIGSRGYVVTYRKVDPLFVLDLGQPENPRVLGQLEMPGYSAYLHPIGDGLLLGIGQDDANEDGLADGMQVSVFDVGDPARPRRVATTKLGSRGMVSGTESDPRTFTWWPDPARAVLTVTNFQSGTPPCPSGAACVRSAPTGFQGAIAVEATASGVSEVGRLASPCTPLRTRVMGDSVVLFSATDVQSASVEDLAPRSSLRLGSGACERPMMVR